MASDDASSKTPAGETWMDEFAALAQRVVLTMDDVRGCLVLSRDGLVLGAFPEEQEAELKPAWLRFTHVGEARKGFVEFSDQLWAFVHRGPYAAFVVTGTSVRPGVMLDQLEQAVIAAEEARAKQKEVTLKVPDASAAPSGRPRTSLHPPADRPAVAPVAAAAAEEEMPSFSAPTGTEGAATGAGGDASQLHEMEVMREQMAQMQQRLQNQPTAGAPQQPMSGYRRPERATPPAPRDGGEAPAGPGGELAGRARPTIEGSAYEAVLPDEQQNAPLGSESSPFARLEAEQAAAQGDAAPPEPAAFRPEPQKLVAAEASEPSEAPERSKDEEEPGEVDRVMLAKEFSGLLQLGEDGDED
jgi:hypothetical protein